MLLELRATDFCCFSTLKLPLSKQGLVWVGGKNLDTAAADSNGSGKSSLFKALTWAIFDQTIDGERGDRLIRDGAKRANVEVDLSDGWQILKERRKGSTRLKLLLDGNEQPGDRKAIQARILELVGLDFQAFKNTILYGQNDSARFADPRVKDSARKEMLHCILRTDVLAACHKLALAKSREGHAAIARMETKANGALAAKNMAKRSMASAKESSAAWGLAREGRIDSARERAMGHKKRAKALLREAPDVPVLEDDLAGLQADLALAEASSEAAEVLRSEFMAARDALAQAGAGITTASAEVRRASEHRDKLTGETCPTCGEDLTSGSGFCVVETVEKTLEVADAQLADARDTEAMALDAVKTAKRALDAEATKAEQAPILRREITSIRALLQTAANVAERVKEVAERAREEVARAKAIALEDNPHHDAVQRHRADAIEARDIGRKMGIQLKAQRVELASIEFWVRGFSGQGLPSFILDSAMPYITEQTNHYLEILTDGDITMEFNTQRELKSAKGEFRDEIDIAWSIEGAEGYPPSGGQLRKMEIATDLALMDLTETREGTGMDLFIADEILDGLDGEGTSRVLKLLHELRSRRGTVFVISHRPSMGEIFEKSITVVKEGGSSLLEVSK